MKRLACIALALVCMSCQVSKGFRKTEPEKIQECILADQMEREFYKKPDKTRRGKNYPVANVSVKKMIRANRPCKQKLYQDSRFNELHGKQNYCGQLCRNERWAARFWTILFIIAIALA